MTWVRYIDRTREYYESEGYDVPYRWAHFNEIPFASLTKPLSACRVGLVTTGEMAVIGEAGAWDEDDPARDVYSVRTDTPIAKLRSKKEAYDRHATTLADVDSYLPLTRLTELTAAGRIKDIAPRFQVIYSEYSQRKTMTVDAPEILRQMWEDRVDVAALTAV